MVLTSVRSCWGRGLPWLLVWTGPRIMLAEVSKSSNGFEKNLEKNLSVVHMRCVSLTLGLGSFYLMRTIASMQAERQASGGIFLEEEER